VKVSIIMPVYNAEAFLREALDSAIRAGTQVQAPFEIIVADNNSSDGSRTILETYRNEYPDLIRLIEVAEQGAPQARNAALRIARGEWIQSLDADDLLNDNKIASQIDRARSDTDWIIAPVRNLWADGGADDDHPLPDPWKGLVYNHLVGHTVSNLYRRSALLRVGGWNEATPLYDDPNLHFSLLRDQAPYLIDSTVNSYYRHHDGTRVTATRHREQSLQATQLVEAVISWLTTHRSAYFRENSTYFYGALLRQLRILATRDLALASELYRTHFPNLDPKIALPLVPTYTRLYPLLGFQNLERLRLALSGILPLSWKQRLKA
jgi:glycosyltransferase involved in cell wall biosynthesis